MSMNQLEFFYEVLTILEIEFGKEALKVGNSYSKTIREAFDDGLTARKAVDRILWLKADRTVNFHA